MNLTQKIIQAHLVKGEMRRGEQIAIRIDQDIDPGCDGHDGVFTIRDIGA